MMEALSNENLQFFDDNGYISMNSAVDSEGILQLRKFCTFLMVNRGVTPEYINSENSQEGFSDKLCWIRCVNQEVEVFKQKVSIFKRLEHWASQLLGLDKENIIVRLRVFYKHPNSDSPVPWHQDEAFYQRYSGEKPEGYRSLNCWIALNHADAKSGCLKYIPGSHRRGLLEHHVLSSSHHEGKLKWQQLKSDGQDDSTLYTTDVKEEEAIYAEVSVGGINIHHCRTLHGSDKNKSDHARGAFVLIFQEKGSSGSDSEAQNF